MSLESCPKCSHKLAPPLKSTGRQICMKCGWSDRPRGASGAKPPTKVQPREDISPLEIQKILAEATEKAKQNMKPRRLQETGDGSSSPGLPSQSSLEDLLRRAQEGDPSENRSAD